MNIVILLDSQSSRQMMEEVQLCKLLQGCETVCPNQILQRWRFSRFGVGSAQISFGSSDNTCCVWTALQYSDYF